MFIYSKCPCWKKTYIDIWPCNYFRVLLEDPTELKSTNPQNRFPQQHHATEPCSSKSPMQTPCRAQLLVTPPCNLTLPQTREKRNNILAASPTDLDLGTSQISWAWNDGAAVCSNVGIPISNFNLKNRHHFFDSGLNYKSKLRKSKSTKNWEGRDVLYAHSHEKRFMSEAISLKSNTRIYVQQ